MKGDPNLSKVELAAAQLGPLLEDVVLVGGCAVGLLISDPASPSVRPTIDVDVIIEIAPATEYYVFCEKLKAQGFSENPADVVICRWVKESLIVDVMPIDPKILGSTNTWYGKAIETATSHMLPSGIAINVVSPPVFLATKMESFQARGNGDYLHHDIEDIINIINGRVEIVDEVAHSDPAVQKFLAEEFDTLLADESFVEQLKWHIADQEYRLDAVMHRMRSIAGV